MILVTAAALKSLLSQRNCSSVSKETRTGMPPLLSWESFVMLHRGEPGQEQIAPQIDLQVNRLMNR